MGKDGYSKGIAFVEYDTHKSAAAALAGTNNTQILGREITVEYSSKSGGSGPGGSMGGGNTESSTLFVGNLGFRTTEDTIWEFFG